jgi:hypothetical protein
MVAVASTGRAFPSAFQTSSKNVGGDVSNFTETELEHLVLRSASLGVAVDVHKIRHPMLAVVTDGSWALTASHEPRWSQGRSAS